MSLMHYIHWLFSVQLKLEFESLLFNSSLFIFRVLLLTDSINKKIIEIFKDFIFFFLCTNHQNTN